MELVQAQHRLEPMLGGIIGVFLVLCMIDDPMTVWLTVLDLSSFQGLESNIQGIYT